MHRLIGGAKANAVAHDEVGQEHGAVGDVDAVAIVAADDIARTDHVAEGGADQVDAVAGVRNGDVARDVNADHVAADEDRGEVLTENLDAVALVAGDDVAGDEHRLQRGQRGGQLALEGVDRGRIDRLHRELRV